MLKKAEVCNFVVLKGCYIISVQMKKYLSFIIASLLVSTVGAQGFVEDGIAYALLPGSPGCCEVTYDPAVTYGGIVNIPAAVVYEGEELAVVGIGPYAFAGSWSLSAVSLPASVRYLGRNAFQSCSSLTSISLSPEVSTVGDQAFYSCSSLASFMGEGVTEIGNAAFSGCSSLYDFKAGKLYYLGDGAFGSCSSLVSFTLPDGIRLGKGVFAGCTSLESVTLPESMTVIPEYTFSDCVALKRVENSWGVTEIGDYAFNTCKSLQTFEFGVNVSSIGRGAFGFCADLAVDSIRGDNATIGAYAFTGCTSLSELKLSGVEEIGEEAFANAVSLKSLRFFTPLHYIRDRAFRNCGAISFVGCYLNQPPFMSASAFDSEVYSRAELNVLFGKGLLYRQSPPWSNFVFVTELPEDDNTSVGKIEEISSIEYAYGILSVSGAPGVVRIHTIDGLSIFEGSKGEDELRVPLARRGLVIVSYNGNSAKVLAY